MLRNNRLPGDEALGTVYALPNENFVLVAAKSRACPARREPSGRDTVGSMERRELFRILAASAVATSPAAAQHPHETAPPADYAAYKPRFFTAAEYETLDRLCEIIIPGDDSSPGAHQPQARFFIDSVLHYGDSPNQQRWRAGLKAVEEAAHSSFGRTFTECGAPQQEAIVARMAQHEGAPENELERFFGPLKRMTIEGYDLSEVGARQGLGYKGDTSLAEFPGCTHPEHKG